MTDDKVFYSWQSDLPNSTNRGFIEKPLEDAVKAIRNDDSIEVEPVVDRDTAGVPGSPDIATTIFAKIEQARVFVCDISIINFGSGSRPTPNPNVLIELGYAIKALGSERIVMIMNTAFGVPEQLPFDLRMRRVITYNMPEDCSDKATERRQLEGKLRSALHTIFIEHRSQAIGEIINPTPIGEEARVAVENAQPNQEALIRKYMNNLLEQLDSIAPDFRERVSDQVIVDSIGQTVELAVEFACLSDAIASMNASKAAMVLYKGFEGILNNYNRPIDYLGSSNDWSFDFYKFIGHELFVILFSFLIREERWETITELLDEDFYIDNLYGSSRAGTASFTYACSNVKSLWYRNQRLNLNETSAHADLINDRHTQGNLSEVVPMQQFMNGDCFLLLRAELQRHEIDGFSGWAAWSLAYIEQTPRYLIEAYRIRNAQKLLAPLKIDTVEMFRNRMIEITPRLIQAIGGDFALFFRRHPLGEFYPEAIGSQQ